jgi:hypothetical protein
MTDPEVVDPGHPEKQPRRSSLKPAGSRIESGSMFYTRLIPIILGVLALLTVALIVVAAGVLIGVIPFR